MKKTIIIILLIIFLPIFVVQADEESVDNENVKQGADLYLQGAAAVNNKDFSQAKEKFEAAAQYLTGKAQEDALRMADFIGRMSDQITKESLLADSTFSIIGEVIEEGRIWHFYNSEQGTSLMHLALEGEKPLAELAQAAGADLFSQEQVIKNRQGYLSQELNYLPGAVSRIRMWYCDKDNTTNIVYENYQSDEAGSVYGQAIESVNAVFNKVECTQDLISSGFNYKDILLGLIIMLLVGGAITFFMMRRKKSKGWRKI